MFWLAFKLLFRPVPMLVFACAVVLQLIGVDVFGAAWLMIEPFVDGAVSWVTDWIADQMKFW